MSQGGISRRDLLKYGIMSAGSAALSGCVGRQILDLGARDQELEFVKYRDFSNGVEIKPSPIGVHSELPKNMRTILIKYPNSGNAGEPGEILGIYFDKADYRSFEADPRYGSVDLSDVVLDEFVKKLKKEGYRNLAKASMSEARRFLKDNYKMREAEESRIKEILEGMGKNGFNDYQVVAIKCTTQGKYPSLKHIIDKDEVLGMGIGMNIDKDWRLTELCNNRYSIFTHSSPAIGGGGGSGAGSGSGGGGSGGGGSGAGSK